MVMVVLVIALIITVVNLRNRPVETAGGPGAASASNAAPQSTPSTIPGTPSGRRQLVPNGFTNCSSQLGAATFCAATPECWAGVISVSDVPSVATAQGCGKRHVYQTFAAGELGYEVRRQSKLEADRKVRRVCTVDVVNSMLRKQDRRSDWEVYGDRPPVDRRQLLPVHLRPRLLLQGVPAEPALTGSALGEPFDPVQQPVEQLVEIPPGGVVEAAGPVHRGHRREAGRVEVGHPETGSGFPVRLG